VLFGSFSRITLTPGKICELAEVGVGKCYSVGSCCAQMSERIVSAVCSKSGMGS
jgi:hypothetical protein